MRSKYHDATPSETPTPGLYGQLIREWVHLNTASTAGSPLRRWATEEPAMAPFTRPVDILDAIDHGSPARKDELLLALIRLYAAGHQLAGRVVLQAMLPKLSQLARSTAGSNRDNVWAEDRQHAVVAEFWDVLSTYPHQRRPRNVAAQLALDTLRRITRDTRALATEIPYEFGDLDYDRRFQAHWNSWPDDVTTEPEQAVLGPSSSDDLEAVLTWATKQRVITREEAHLLEAVFLTPAEGSPMTQSAVAANLNISPAAMRQRYGRLRQRLADALHDEFHAQSREKATA